MDLSGSYDRVADEYAARIYGELTHKPFDRALLNRFAGRVRGRGPVCDLGCGPGQVARFLADAGVEAFGLDLSPGMVAVAGRLNPDLRFAVGDLFALPAADGAWAGVAAFYSIVHLTPGQLGPAFREVRRVLAPGGLLAVAFHIGDQTMHVDDLWGRPVDLDFRFIPPAEVTAALADAGFEVEEWTEREPYPDVEYQSRRAYGVARKL